MSEKILIGRKENTNSGYVFYPYITILELHLPIKLVRFDNNQPVFTKTELEKS